MSLVDRFNDLDKINYRVDKTESKFIKSQKILNFDETVDYIKVNCEEWLKYPVDIQRGINTNDFNEYYLTNPVKRFSRDDKNFLNLIIDNTWDNHQKRNKSLMCSYKKTYIGEYRYSVIPEDGSKWTILPNHDIHQWVDEIFPEYFFDEIDDLYYNIFNKYMDDINFKNFEKNIISLQKYLKNYNINELLDKQYVKFTKPKIEYIINEYFLSNDNTLKFIIDKLDPDKNNVKLYNLKQIYNDNTFKNNEMWTETRCIMVSEFKIRKLKKELNLK